MQPLINILIRTCYRPRAFKNCLESVLNQSYKNVRIIVCYDNTRAIDYIPEDIEKFKVRRGIEKYFYDNYCNLLKERVDEGYFMFLDDDDYLFSPTILEEIIPKLSPDFGTIVRLKRNDMVRPLKNLIESGRIGMPCLILHHSHKFLADIPPTGQGDYFWIKEVESKLPLRYEPIIVVSCSSRGNGKIERRVDI